MRRAPVKIRVMLAQTTHVTRHDANALGSLMRKFKPHVLAPWGPGKSGRSRKKSIQAELHAISGSKGLKNPSFRKWFARIARDYFERSRQPPRVYLIERESASGKQPQLEQLEKHRLSREEYSAALNSFRKGDLASAREHISRYVELRSRSVSLRADEMTRGWASLAEMLKEYPDLIDVAKREGEVRVLAYQGLIHSGPYHSVQEALKSQEPASTELIVKVMRKMPGSAGKPVVYPLIDENVRRAVIGKTRLQRHEIAIDVADRILMEETLDVMLMKRVSNSIRRYKICRELALELIRKTNNPQSAFNKQLVDSLMPEVVARLNKRRLI